MKRKKHNQPGGARPKLDPRQREMADAAISMIQTLTCPVALAEDHAARCLQYGQDAESMGDVALLARDLYRKHGSPLALTVAPILEDFAAVMERHARELDQLAARFGEFDDHDAEHDHLETSAIDLKALAFAMFGPPDAPGVSGS